MMLRARHNLFHVPPHTQYRDATAAIITLEDGRYLMQLRDDKPGIFFPDHWGLFGGAIDTGETGEMSLRRELKEELDYDAGEIRYFTRINFSMEGTGAEPVVRMFYLVEMPSAALGSLTLGEGRQMQPLTAEELLLEKRVVPYDSFAIWVHWAWRQGRTETPEN